MKTIYWVECHFFPDDCYYRLATYKDAEKDLTQENILYYPEIFGTADAARNALPGQVLPGDPVDIWIEYPGPDPCELFHIPAFDPPPDITIPEFSLDDIL